MIGTTTVEEYSRYIEKDAALARRFQAVYVNEPSQEETIQILKGLRLKYENHHKVIIPEQTITTAVRLAARYYPSKRFPDKAIDLIDEAASRLRNRNESVPMRITSIEKEIEKVQSKIDHAIISFQDISKVDEEELIKLQEERGKIYKAWRDQNQMVNLIFETQANTIRLKEEVKTKRASNEDKEMLSRLAESIRTNDKTISDLYSSLNSSNLDSSSALSQSHNTSENKAPGSVAFRNTLEEKDVAEIIAIETGIPLDSMLVKENSSSLVSMEDDLKEQIIGQNNAIQTIAKCIRLSKAGLRFHDRPIGVFLFLGPTVSSDSSYLTFSVC
jgi:ATP-dependent Clp protease ATP-binding subunit ClpB